jgi:predicted adenine nucleotide alpha hydrolase (AANH) superfamily ATPase
VDSHYFLKRLRENFPNEPLSGFFYNPNIHPYEEYQLRLLDVARSCKKYGVELIEGDYDYEAWLLRAKGFELEKERGERCEICFEARLEATAKKAKEIGEKTITTTLFMSPKKSFEQLSVASNRVSQKESVEVLCFDFRKGGGTNEQFKLAKEDRLYRQNYCGCLYALSDQREAQKRIADELMRPIGKEILPCSILDRTKVYEKICEREKEGGQYVIEKEKFQNYRLLRGRVFEGGRVTPSYIMGKYKFEKDLQVKIEAVKDGFAAQDNIAFLNLDRFNKMANTNYASVKELIFNPIDYQKRLNLERILADYQPIIVLDEIKSEIYKIEAISAVYEDVREVLAIL